MLTVKFASRKRSLSCACFSTSFEPDGADGVGLAGMEAGLAEPFGAPLDGVVTDDRCVIGLEPPCHAFWVDFLLWWVSSAMMVDA